MCHTQSTLTYQSTFLVTKDHRRKVLTFVNMFSLESDPLGGPKVSQKSSRAKKTNSLTLGGPPLLPTRSTCSCPADLLVITFDILWSPKWGLGIGEEVFFWQWPCRRTKSASKIHTRGKNKIRHALGTPLMPARSTSRCPADLFVEIFDNPRSIQG